MKVQGSFTTVDGLGNSPGPWHYPWRLMQKPMPLGPGATLDGFKATARPPGTIYPWQLRQKPMPLALPLTTYANAQAPGTTFDGLGKSPATWHYPWRHRQQPRPLAQIVRVRKKWQKWGPFHMYTTLREFVTNLSLTSFYCGGRDLNMKYVAVWGK